MKRIALAVLSCLLYSLFSLAQMAPNARPVQLMSGLGDLHHPVSTSNPQAQQFFDQGLRLIYAFNHDEAELSFRRAVELDPNLAMAYWGIAEAVGPNYNDPASDERFAAAHQAIQKATDLSLHASASEKAYIEAMALRFPADPKADRRKAAMAYRDAMRQVSQRFPDDLDAATLSAEAGMNLHPWGLWRKDGLPQEGTEEIVTTLESVIRRDPNHLGAVHYYIHAVEASMTPERALAPANHLASLAPAAGHIVHMPAHIYIRTGAYQAGVETNLKAVAADDTFLSATGEQGIYPMMYYSHNLHFVASCASMNGDYTTAVKAANQLSAHVAPYVSQMPPLEAFMTVPLTVNVRFHQWDKILGIPQPAADMKATTVFWHFARGMALAGTGKPGEAQAEYKIVWAAEEATSPDEVFAMPVDNKTKDILMIASNVLAAKIALASGDSKTAIAKLNDAVAIQDTLNYDEPPDWFYPVRESLGASLLGSGDAPAAERVFREDLVRNPRNPRSLFGLQQALLAQGRTYDAGFVETQFRAGWKGDGAALKIEDLM